MKILIVEDEILIALSMADSLGDAGHQVVGLARDHGTAMHAAQETHPDLALVDLHLANATRGTVVAQDLRQRFDIPSIFVTGNPNDCQHLGPRVGALACLSKPFTPDELTLSVKVASSVMRLEQPDKVPPNLEIYFVS